MSSTLQCAVSTGKQHFLFIIVCLFVMGKVCADKLCQTGKAKAQEHHREATLHTFRTEWQGLIPGGNDLKITPDTRLCSLHFDEQSYITERIVKRSERSDDLKRKNLKPGALPVKWPDHPWHYRPRQTSLATVGAREEKQAAEERKQNFASINDVALKLSGNAEAITLGSTKCHDVKIFFGRSGQVVGGF